MDACTGLGRRICASVLLALLACPAAIAGPVVEEKLVTAAQHSSDLAQPLDPLRNVVDDNNTAWRAAITLVADPVDTRLGRSFDIQVSTLIRSFQFDGYVLQSHALPWKVGKRTSQLISHESTPGVLVFRRDLWRDNPLAKPAVSYFVMFLVGESPVFGVQRGALCRAAIQASLLNQGMLRPDIKFYAPCEASNIGQGGIPMATLDPHQPPVPVLGPGFSGSMSSLADVARVAGVRMALMSPSATVDSNAYAQSQLAKGWLSFKSYATWGQTTQLQAMFDYLLTVHNICPGHVTVLAEESSFGQGAVDFSAMADPTLVKRLQRQCSSWLVPRRMQFSQNIASIRAEHAVRNASKQVDGKTLSLLPSRNLELDMKDAALSLDLPPEYQPSLTSRSEELSLQQLMDALATLVRPKAVLIVATDVRDRIYMLAQVRQALPGTLPIVLEGDHLLAHPDYRRANRGVIMVHNTPRRLCFGRVLRQSGWSPDCGSKGIGERRYFSFPTDYGASLFRANWYLLHPEKRQIVESSQREPLALITLAGTQAVSVKQNKPRNPGAGMLIAADLRVLAVNMLVPLLMVLSIVLLFCSLWLRFSTRPGRAIVPLTRHALRETGWYLQAATRKLLRRKSKRRYQRKTPRRRAYDLASPHVTNLLCLLAAVLSITLIWEWSQVVLAAAGRGSSVSRDYNFPMALSNFLLLVHGRHAVMAYVLAAIYAWFALLVIARLHAWNLRCRLHWRRGRLHPGRNPHASRRYHGTSVTVALLFSLPLLVAWAVRNPQTVDPTTAMALLSFIAMTACLYFVVQAGLQTHRLFQLARVIRDQVIEGPGKRLLADGWPTPRQIGMPPQSPIAVLFRDYDWRALHAGRSDWPILPAPKQAGNWQSRPEAAELDAWRERTVAEMKYGLVCIRSCLWAAFTAPLAVLAMIQVHPFPFENEQSTLALLFLGLAFIATAFITYHTEKAPLIGQMFTQDGAHVSFVDMLKALGGKLLLMALILAATLAPELGQSLDQFVGMLKL